MVVVVYNMAREAPRTSFAANLIVQRSVAAAFLCYLPDLRLPELGCQRSFCNEARYSRSCSNKFL